jgi:cyanophycinase
MRNLFFCFAVFFFCLSYLNVSGQKYIGPERGYLVLSGGGEDTGSFRKFVQLVGANSKILIITTAAPDDEQNEENYSRVKKGFASVGATNTDILHTRDSNIANSPAFLKKIREAKGVWFIGGNPVELTKAYLHTDVMIELQDLLNRDGVIGGNSAGANVLGAYFIRYNVQKKEFVQNSLAFNFLKNTCIIPHVLEYNRQFQFAEFRKQYPNLLGIGIDGSTTLIIHKKHSRGVWHLLRSYL